MTIQTSYYHEGSRHLQDQFGSRPLADRLEEVAVHPSLDPEEQALITRSAMFFLATADTTGQPECSYKGGFPGFVCVVDERTIAFPDYDGNGMFRSLGNVVVNPHVGLLFIDFAAPTRLRVSGTASLHVADPLLSAYPGAQMIVRVHIEHVLANCPRYVHKMQHIEYSPYVPQDAQTPPVPAWKQKAIYRDVLPQHGEPQNG